MDKQWIIEVQNLIAEVDKTHRYSMSRIYGLWNRVYDKNEAPQSCASCLIRKVKELREWLANQPTTLVDDEVEKTWVNEDSEQSQPTAATAKRRGRKKKE